MKTHIMGIGKKVLEENLGHPNTGKGSGEQG